MSARRRASVAPATVAPATVAPEPARECGGVHYATGSAPCWKFPRWKIHVHGVPDTYACDAHLSGNMRWMLAQSDDWQAFTEEYPFTATR